MNDWYDAEQQVEKAQELFEQQKWPEALELLRAAVAINPYNSAWQFNIGLTLDEMERYGEAIEAYEEALTLQPDDLEALNHLGIDLTRVGRFEDAIRNFERIESLDATFEPSYCNRIGAYSEMGEHEKAEEMFYLARLYKDQCPDCYYAMGCSLQARELYDKAIYCWQKTIDLDDQQSRRHRYAAGLRRVAAGDGSPGRSGGEIPPGDRTGAGSSGGVLLSRAVAGRGGAACRGGRCVGPEPGA